MYMLLLRKGLRQHLRQQLSAELRCDLDRAEEQTLLSRLGTCKWHMYTPGPQLKHRPRRMAISSWRVASTSASQSV